MSTDEASEEKMTSVYQTLRSNFRGGEVHSVAYRSGALRRFKRLVKDHESEITAALEKDLKMNEATSYLSNIMCLYAEVDHVLDCLASWAKPRALDTPLFLFPSHSYELCEPLGVVLVIGAWNYPFATSLVPLVAAIAAGNCVLVKPSEQAPHSAKVMAKIMGLMDQRYFAAVEGGVETSKFLNKQPFDLIVFTGGTQTGRFVMKDAADNLSKVCLELGGKNPTVVDASANLELSAKRLVSIKFMNCGQTCISPDLLFVHASIKDAFMQALIEQIRLVYSDDAQTSKEYGKIVNARQTKRVLGYLEGQEDKVVFQAGKVDAPADFVPPTLLLEPKKTSSLMREEVFGPLLAITEFTDFPPVLEQINAYPKPLCIYYYGDTSSHNYARLRNETSSGSLVANDSGVNYLLFTGGFGGVGDSGMGKIRGHEGFKYCSHQKVVIERSRSAFLDLPARYAPTSPATLRQLRFLGDKIGGKTFEAIFGKVKLVVGLLVVSLLVYVLLAKRIVVING